MAGITKPFNVKGKKITSPKGQALWCKLDKPDREYNEKGMYSTDLVCDPGCTKVKAFIENLEELRDTAMGQANKKAKGKKFTARPVFKEEYDKDGEETGNIIFKFKMNNVDDRREGQNKVTLVGPKASKGAIPMVTIGNGSEIRCVAFANPYSMASDKTIGVSLILEKVQLIELVSFEDNDGLEDEDGELPEETDADGLSDEAEDIDEENGDF